ncbi:MAG: precorrin-3B C(17)-methyltransferase [Syntrophorhabdales bacterium]|jgi:cobalt-precorrin 5A hydrolase/precorrin-3B C17-methyltransferase
MATGNRTVLFSVTERGRILAETIAACYPGAVACGFSREAVEANWAKGARLVFIMAAGIVVRTIAPLIGDKRTDPAVVLLDEAGAHVVSLLGGHLGGANALAKELARLTGGSAVITTASDVNDLPALDVWAKEQDLAIENPDRLPKAGTKLIDHKMLSLFSDIPLEAPAAFLRTEDPASADIVVTNKEGAPGRVDVLLLRPKNLVAGIGCNSGTSAGEIEEALRKTLDAHSLSFLSVRAVATIDKKMNEPGLRAFAERNDMPLIAFTPMELNRVADVSPSDAAWRATGARAVAEPSAILASGGGCLIVHKHKAGNVTIAVAEAKPGERGEHGDPRKAIDRRGPAKGALYVVGTGPGSIDHLTPRALAAIRESDVIVGYGPYLDLLGGLIADKETVTTGMLLEIDRCERAIELSAEGRTVSVVSGGDPGIYAMAGLVLELLRKCGASSMVRTVEIIPGISALSACAARLGAPLMHDFASISLSDRLTPWQTIEARLDAAARADFVIVLYNPRSRARDGHIRKARQIILRHRAAATPVGIVKAAMRAHEKVIVTDLDHMPLDEIDMQTTVIVGNSKTAVWRNLMITPRGYENKER